MRTSLWNSNTCQEGLILLVGASPLPNLLSVLALRPPKVALICSEQTAATRGSRPDAQAGVRELVSQIRQVRPHEKEGTTDVWRFGENDWLTLPSAHDPLRVREGIMGAQWGQKELGGWVLNYTGGTKVMASQALNVWYEHGGQAQHACYLADVSRTLFFDDGTSCWLRDDDISVSLEALGHLHGIRHLNAKPASLGRSTGNGPIDSDVRAILGSVCHDAGVAGWLCAFATYPSRDCVPKGQGGMPKGQGGKQHRELRRTDLTSPCNLPMSRLSVRALDPSMAEPVFDDWVTFLRGGWLEAAVAGFVSRSARAGGETWRNVTGRIPIGEAEQKFEVDVAHVGGARVQAVSCGIGGSRKGDPRRNRKEIKLKLFEIMERARQLGGGLARAGVVCLFEEGECRTLEGEVVRNFVGDEPRPRVWGRDSLCEWHRGNLSSLREWLTPDAAGVR